MTWEVRQADPDDLSALVETKVAAFYDDPVQRWLFPNDRTRADSIRRASRHGTRRQLARGEVWCTTDRRALAVWQRPDRPKAGLMVSLLRQITLVPLVPRIGPPLRAALSAGNLFVQHEPSEPHWELGSLATHPEARRAGRGSALVAAGLEMCDRSRVGCFLANTNPLNLSLYQGFGFERLADVTLPASGPAVTMMDRRADTSGCEPRAN